jgi:hypothetical protein
LLLLQIPGGTLANGFKTSDLVVTGKPTNGTTCIYNNTGGTLTLLGSKHLIFVTGGTTKWYNRIYKQLEL